MSKIILAAALLLALAGCQHGYFRLNQAPRHDGANWAAITDAVGQQLKK